jgi:hypothetical protein
MFGKIKKYLIAAALIAAAYFIGKRRGKDDEKIKNLEKARKKIADAARARARLGDPDFVRRLRERYGRK